jgi:AcrR family transcriptional regulator
MKQSRTKERIMDAAINLFSERGYDLVSMRDIAQIVGIKAASIYNHFPSKRDILKAMYEFHALENKLATPALETLLSMAETEPLPEVLTKMKYVYPPEIHEKMDRILMTASQRVFLDKDSETFVRVHFFEHYIGIWTPLMKRLIELGRIEPIDVDGFVRLLINYAYGAAIFYRTTINMNADKSFSMVLSLLKPIIA